MDGPLGVYVHVPFCLSRCDYCAFVTFTDRPALTGAYVEACIAAVRRRLDDRRPVTSVYLGGGTPSLLTPEQIAGILGSIPRSPGRVEVTVECNPETVDRERLAGYRDAGVTRLSFGVQSMVAHVLAGLGRAHDPEAVHRAVEAAGAAGFAGAYSVDLIMGGAGESRADWAATLDGVLALDPPPAHVSAYGLTVEPGTPLAGEPSRHPDPDDQADKYLMAEERLTAAGLEWYEISNWARPGAECRHNQLYWDQGEYEGIGAAAHSHRVRSDGGADRWWNVRTPERFIASVAAGGSGRSAGERLTAVTRRRERLELALRTRAGVPASALPGWGRDPALERLVEPRGDRLVLTLEGRLLANEVALRLAP
jgi:putative oxygen-independent coproporphyrinogen III oxidase